MYCTETSSKSDTCVLTGVKNSMTVNPQYLALVQKKQNFHS